MNAWWLNKWISKQTNTIKSHPWRMKMTRLLVGPPLSEPGLSFFALLDSDFFTNEWHRDPVVRSNWQTSCARVHMRSHVKIPSEWKGNVEKNPFSTIHAFVGSPHPFQKLFFWSDTSTCIFLQYWLSHHIQELELSTESHLLHLPSTCPSPTCEENPLTSYTQDLPGRRSYHFFLVTFTKVLFIKV